MLNRRYFLSSALGLAISDAFVSRAYAQKTGETGPLVQFREIQKRFNTLVPDVEKSAALPIEKGSYDVLLPALLNIIDKSAEVSQTSAEKSLEAQDVQKSAQGLLLKQAQEERSPAVDFDKAAVDRYPYEKLKDEYLKLFDGAEIRGERADLVKWHVSQLKKDAYRKRYEEVGEALKIPWYFVGIIHSLEAGFNFQGHLHNGDPLTGRTTHEPKGRPAAGQPPFDWVTSAIDALTLKNFNGQPDWSLPRMLYRWEAYNGFGYRGRKVPTPYLWSFTKRYGRPESVSGKFVADGRFDSNAVSLQCGASAFLIEMIKTGDIPMPARG